MPAESPRWRARVDPLAGVRHLHELVWLMLRGRVLCEQDRLDVFWGAITILPRLPKSIRAVVTVYDLFHMDRTLVPLKRWLGYRLLYERSLARADAIMAISDATAQKLSSILGYETTAVVRPGISEKYRTHCSEEVDTCLRLYGIQRPYLFAVASSFERRKNLGSLLEAFLRSEG
jgi:glycosyltransferase involved in cell wall biosynthesis